VDDALLMDTGLQIEFAVNGQEAVEKLHAGKYDLVLMDLQMPEMDGFEATRMMRQRPEFAKLPIIAMTANAFKEDSEACLQAGMNDHLAKPVNPERLFATLCRWLGQGA